MPLLYKNMSHVSHLNTLVFFDDFLSVDTYRVYVWYDQYIAEPNYQSGCLKQQEYCSVLAHRHPDQLITVQFLLQSSRICCQ